MDSESEKLAALSERIRQTQAGREDKSSGSARVGIDFVGSIVGAGVLGALCDHVFDTAPWCLLGFVLVGFVGGMITVWRSLQKNDETGK